jgi:outer membrane protein, heavy metal efflux system
MRVRLVCLCLWVAAGATARVSAAATDRCGGPFAGGVLTVSQAAARFLQCNTALEQVRASTEAAQGDLQSASHPPNPTLGLSVSNINPQVGTGNGALWHRTVDSAVRMDQLIERGGKLAARRDTAQGALRAADAQLEDATQRGLQGLIETYATASAADAAVKLLQEAASSYRESLRAMYQRLAVGDVAEVEVQRTALDAARADADAEAARIDQLRARSDLALALGTDQLPDSVELMSLDALAVAVSGGAVGHEVTSGTGLAERPDLRAAAARVESSAGALRLARAARTRDVDVTLGLDHWPASAQNLQGTGNSYTIGVSVPLFLYDSGRGGVRRAAADLRTAQSDLNARTEAAGLELQRLVTQQQQAEELSARYTRQLLPAAESILAAEETAYRRGGVSVLDLLDARRSERQVAVAAITTRRDAILYRARLAVALGRMPLDVSATPILPVAGSGR